LSRTIERCDAEAAAAAAAAAAGGEGEAGAGGSSSGGKGNPPELALIASKDIIESPTVTCRATPIEG